MHVNVVRRAGAARTQNPMNAMANLVDSLRARGVGVVRLPKRHALALQRVHRLGYRFFKNSSLQLKQSCRRSTTIPALGAAAVMIGHYQPSDAKELLRTFDEIPHALPRPLRVAMGEARSILNELLLGCMVACCQAAGHPVSRRSLRLACRSCCPLDLFFYHNRSSVPNCSPHVDRGFLHAIVASPVSGLEVLSNDSQGDCWRAPHELWPDIEPHAHVIILANDTLARLSRGWDGGEEDDGWRCEACVHRVVNERTPRLSISYELRPSRFSHWAYL